MTEFSMDFRDILIIILAVCVAAWLTSLLWRGHKLARHLRDKLDGRQQFYGDRGMKHEAKISHQLETRDVMGAIFTAVDHGKDVADPNKAALIDVEVLSKYIPLALNTPKVRPEALAQFVVWCKANETLALAVGVKIVPIVIAGVTGGVAGGPVGAVTAASAAAALTAAAP